MSSTPAEAAPAAPAPAGAGGAAAAEQERSANIFQWHGVGLPAPEGRIYYQAFELNGLTYAIGACVCGFGRGGQRGRRRGS